MAIFGDFLRPVFSASRVQQVSDLHSKFRLSHLRLPVAKNHNFWQILTFLGAPVPTPFTDEGQIWCPIADPRYTFTCAISSRSVYSVVLWLRKTPNFCRFWTSAFSGVANWQQSEKVEHGCTTTNLPLSNDIKIVSVPSSMPNFTPIGAMCRPCRAKNLKIDLWVN